MNTKLTLRLDDHLTPTRENMRFFDVDSAS